MDASLKDDVEVGTCSMRVNNRGNYFSNYPLIKHDSRTF